MAIKFYCSTSTYHCPKCKTILKKEKRDDSLTFIYVFLFIPIGLIALIVYLIKRITEKTEFNKFGEQIICCPNCQSMVAISSNGGIAGYSRIILQEKELLEMVKPLIDYLHTDFDIDYDKYNNDEKYSEMLGLRFKNVLGDKCNVFILNIYGELEMKVDNGHIEPFDIKKLAFKIIDILNWVKIYIWKTRLKTFLIILICIRIYGIINNLFIYSNRKNEIFTSKTLPVIPMSALPLEITKGLNLYKTTDNVYYGREIYNSSNEEITIEELSYNLVVM